MRFKDFLRKESVLLAPIFFLFTLIIVFIGKDIPLSDGVRYWQTAQDILSGFKDKEVINSPLFWNGPFYPFLLSIFQLFGMGVKACIGVNAIFIYVGCLLFYKLLKDYLPSKKALFVTYLLVFIDPFIFYWSAKLYTEPLAFFLICWIFYAGKFFFKTKSNKYFFQTAIGLGLLILTKVIFSYVVLLMIFLSAMYYLVKKTSASRRLFKISSLGLFVTVPYLIFTFSITKMPFYYSNGGGMLLYWISSPHKTDLGEWHVFDLDALKDHLASRYHTFSGLDSTYLRNVNDVILNKMKSDHQPFLNTLAAYNNPVLRDNYLKKSALENIKNHPFIFARNWLLNSGRLLIGYPHAVYFKPPYSPVLSLINILKSSLLLFLLIASLLLFLWNIHLFDNYIQVVVLFATIYLLGQSLLAVQSQRFLIPLYPLLLLFISVIFGRLINIKRE